MEIQERPAHYEGPNLDPTGVKLHPRFLGRGVYALLASRTPRDNSGVVIGSRGALVIDSGINGEMATHIQDTVRKLTDKPILYLVKSRQHELSRRPHLRELCLSRFGRNRCPSQDA